MNTDLRKARTAVFMDPGLRRDDGQGALMESQVKPG
jgi:hypothetical protein